MSSVQNHTLLLSSGLFCSREELYILAQHVKDPTDQLFVFFNEEPRLGVKSIRRCAGAWLVAD